MTKPTDSVSNGDTVCEHDKHRADCGACPSEALREDRLEQMRRGQLIPQDEIERRIAERFVERPRPPEASSTWTGDAQQAPAFLGDNEPRTGQAGPDDLLARAKRYLNQHFMAPDLWTEHDAETIALVEMMRPSSAPIPRADYPRPKEKGTFAERLLAIWCEAQDVALDPRDFPAWDGATKDLLLGLGLEWNDAADCYELLADVAKERRDSRPRPETARCTHPSGAQKWFALGQEIAVRWCKACGALNSDGETWVALTGGEE